MSEPYDVLVVGGGVIGMAVAWRCAQRELAVAVVDPAPGSGATRTAAGMLAPVAELRALHDFQASLGVTSRLLTGSELRDAEPALAAGLPGGLWAADDHQVDPRRLHAALLAAAGATGVQLLEDRVAEIQVRDGRAVGVALAGGAEVSAGTVVVAAGAWSRRLGLPPEIAPQVRPVKGQTLRL